MLGKLTTRHCLLRIILLTIAMICWQLLRLVKDRFCEFHQGTFAPVAMVFIMRPAAIGMVVALLFSIYMSFKVQK